MLGMEADKSYGRFGNLSLQYHLGRRDYPTEVIEYVHARTRKTRPRILDIACGTGIATRQLHHAGALVVGTDISPEMIVQAQLHNDQHIEFRIAPANTQPFAPKSFDAVTVFSAFHWFSNEDVLFEIARVMKADGKLFIINKSDLGDFKADLRKIVKQVARKQLPDSKEGYDPASQLSSHGFIHVETECFHSAECYSIESAINYYKSTSLWNLVPESRNNDAMRMLRETLLEQETRGALVRQMEIIVVSADVDPTSRTFI